MSFNAFLRLLGLQMLGQANYAAAKSAVIGLSKTIAKEWGVFGVRANTVAFGYIITRYASIPHAP